MSNNTPNTKFRIMQLAQKLAQSANQPDQINQELKREFDQFVKTHNQSSPEVAEAEIRKMLSSLEDETEE